MLIALCPSQVDRFLPQGGLIVDNKAFSQGWCRLFAQSAQRWRLQVQCLAIKMGSCFYRDKQGIKGLLPLSPAPQIPAEAPSLRYGKLSSTRMVVDEAEH